MFACINKEPLQFGSALRVQLLFRCFLMHPTYVLVSWEPQDHSGG